MNREKLHITYAPVSELRAAEYNPRYWSKEAIGQLTESIKRYGFVDPVLVNSAPKRKGVVIGGHFRLSIAKNLGIERVPVVYINIPNLAKEKELNLRLNKNVGDWDWAKLAEDFDLDELMKVGFNDDDLSRIFDDNTEVKDDEFDEKEGIKRAKTTKIKSGDMFALGRHRLLCADATNPESARKIMGGVRADMINDDMPYNIGLSYDKGVGGKAKYGGKHNDSQSEKDYRAFVQSIMENALAVSKPDAHVFFWCDERWVYLFQQLYAELGIHSLRLCIWIKDNQSPTPNAAFNKVTEFVAYGTVGRPYLNEKVMNLNEIINKETTTGNQLTNDILDLLNIWLVKRISGNEYQHPTQKPPTLHEKALRRCTRPGDAVLDLTAGSGSILSACEQLGRTAYCCEMEPIFCQVIINRYEKLTDQKAVKI